MLNHSIHIKTDSFDGPLGLLLLLIQREEMNIRDLDINKITGQYLNYIQKMHELNFNIVGDYLYMAATLVLLKSGSFVNEEEARILSGSEEENTLLIPSQEELIKRLQELQKHQRLGEQLWDLPRRGVDTYTRPRFSRNELAQHKAPDLDIQDLLNILINFLSRSKRRYQVLKSDQLSIKDRILFLKNLLKLGDKTSFFDILDKDESEGQGAGRLKILLTFISLLELVRLRKLAIHQNENLGNIFVEVKESLSEFNIDLANGFEPNHQEAN